MSSGTIIFKVHASIKACLLERCTALGIVPSDELANKLEPKVGEHVTEFTKEEVDTLKDVLSIKNYALFFSKEKPETLINAKGEILFRGNINRSVDRELLEQLEWAERKRFLYLGLLEDTKSPYLALITSYKTEIIPFQEDIPRVAKFFREKLQLNRDTDKNRYLRNLIYSIEMLGVLVFAQKSEARDSGVDGFTRNHVPYPVIFFNPNRAFARQLFTIAHELAHIIFDGEDKGEIDDKIDMTDNDKKEKRANTFAAYLLMPADIMQEKYNDQVKKGCKEPLTNLHNHFYVSKKAIFHHIKELSEKGHLSISETELRKLAPKSGEDGHSWPLAQSKPSEQKLLEHGINSTFQFLKARAGNLIGSKDYYSFFEHSNPKDHPYDAKTFAEIERMFSEDDVL